MIGLGLRANLVDVIHRPGQGSVLVGLCDIDRDALEGWGSHVRPKPFLTVDRAELFRHVDAVVVATPDHTHQEIVIDALRAGIPTFAEKPLGISTEGCDAMLRAAYETGTRLYVGHNMRHFSMVRTMKKLIDDGAIGEPMTVWCRHFVSHGGDFYFKDWHAQRRHTNSLLLQKGAHDIDVIHWLAGGVSRRVNAMGKLAVYGRVTDRHNGERHDDWFSESHWPPLAQKGLHPEIDIEDLALMQMECDNGVLAAYQECHFSPDYWRNYTVIGTEGRIENFGDTTGTVRLWNQRGGYRETPDHEIPFNATAGSHGGADALLMAEFVRFARDGGPTDTSPIAAREAVAAGCAATESLRSGGIPVDVPPPADDLANYFSNHQVR